MVVSGQAYAQTALHPKYKDLCFRWVRSQSCEEVGSSRYHKEQNPESILPSSTDNILMY
jgi:hypothetical protein